MWNPKPCHPESMDGGSRVSSSRKRKRKRKRTRTRTRTGVPMESSSLEAELSKGIGLKKIGAGLANLGNTCFLNSVLQCLTYTEPLAAYLQSGRHKIACRASGFCAMCAIQNHVMNALSSSGKILEPSLLVKNLRRISRSFRISRQEDAHEYMVMLMESMHKCCLPSGIASASPRAYEKSLVHKIFGGRLRSQVKCRQCSYCSNTYEPFLDLSLEIVQSDSLLKVLSHFTAIEQLGGGEKVYECQRCKVKVQAVKQFTVDKVPYILAIHLKRFGPTGGKINRKVEFGRILNMKPFVSGPHDGDLKYTLYGVLVHAGWSTHSGHYYCFIRTSTGVWHALDDNRAYKVSEQVVLEQKAYKLFYVRDKQTLNQLSVKSKHQGSELEHNNPTLLNVTLKKECHLLASLAHVIPKLSSCLNSNGAAVSTEKDTVPRKETLLDNDTALEDAESRHNTKLASSAGKQHVSIQSLSKLPSISNSDVTENDNVGTKHATRNEPQGAAIIMNVGIDDPAGGGECNMGKDLVNHTTDNGEKTSTHLSNAIVDDQHEIVKILDNSDMIDHTYSNGRSAAKKLMNSDKFIPAASNAHQLTESPLEVHISHHLMVGESNDAQDLISGDVSVMPRNHGNETALPSTESFEGVSVKKIEPLDLSQMIKECNSSSQMQDSNCHLHKKRVKFQKLVRHYKLVMPLSRRFLLFTALSVSKKKRSFKREKQSHAKCKSLLCSGSVGRCVKSMTSSAPLWPPIVEIGSETNVPNFMSNRNCFLNSWEPKENHELMMSSVQNGCVYAKTVETNFESHLLPVSAKTSSRQICTQNCVREEGELKHNSEQLCIGTCMGRSNDLVSKYNGNDHGLYSGGNKKAFSVLLQLLENGNAPCNSSAHKRRNLVSSCLNRISSNFRDKCEQDRARVYENAILQKTCLELDRVDIDKIPYEKKASGGYVIDGWAEGYDSSKKKKVKTFVCENVIIYGNKRQVDDCNNPFQAIAIHKVQTRKSRGRNVATRNNPARI